MGCKALKAHYGIKHIVARYPEKGICIGSPYCHDLIAISPPDRKPDVGEFRMSRVDIGLGLVIWRQESLGRGEPFDGWVAQWVTDPATLRRLIDAPDTFARSIPVWTFDDDGNIIEHACEEPGWPNITHDGLVMYENRFFTERADAVAYARKEYAARIENMERNVKEAERVLEEKRTWLIEAMTALDKLERSEGKAP